MKGKERRFSAMGVGKKAAKNSKKRTNRVKADLPVSARELGVINIYLVCVQNFDGNATEYSYEKCAAENVRD